jgi:hypothetical protein
LQCFRKRTHRGSALDESATVFKAEALSTQKKEFLIKKHSDLCELGVSVVKITDSPLVLNCFEILSYLRDRIMPFFNDWNVLNGWNAWNRRSTPGVERHEIAVVRSPPNG